MIFLYCTICFFLEVITSYLANWVNVSIISRKPYRAVKFSLATGVAGWAILFIIGKLSDWNLYIMAASIMGDALGDYIVASRKIKPKTKKLIYRKKFPVSTA